MGTKQDDDTHHRPPVGDLEPSPAPSPDHETTSTPELVPAQVLEGVTGGAPVGPVTGRAAEWSEGSAQRAARAYEVLGLYVERAARMVHTAPPGAIAPVMRTLLEVARLEGGQSTSNVAVVLSPQERRARILELSARLGAELLDDAAG